jgi:hypothetical protein
MTVTTNGDAKDGAMTENENGSNRTQLRAGLLITGAALVGAGALIAVAGLAVGGTHLLSVARRRVSEMEVPPSELAKLRWTQAKAAATAGAAAWQNGIPARQASES